MTNEIDGKVIKFKIMDNIFAIKDIPEDVVRIIYKYYMTMMRHKNLIKTDNLDMLYQHRKRWNNFHYARYEPPGIFMRYLNQYNHIRDELEISDNISNLLDGVEPYLYGISENEISYRCHMCMYTSVDYHNLRCEGENCYYNRDYHNNMPLICEACLNYKEHEDDEYINITYCSDRCLNSDEGLLITNELIDRGLKCYGCSEIDIDCESDIEICCNDGDIVNLCERCDYYYYYCYECEKYIEKNSPCDVSIKGIPYCCACRDKIEEISDDTEGADSGSSEEISDDSDDSVISGC